MKLMIFRLPRYLCYAALLWLLAGCEIEGLSDSSSQLQQRVSLLGEWNYRWEVSIDGTQCEPATGTITFVRSTHYPDIIGAVKVNGKEFDDPGVACTLVNVNNELESWAGREWAGRQITQTKAQYLSYLIKDTLGAIASLDDFSTAYIAETYSGHGVTMSLHLTKSKQGGGSGGHSGSEQEGGSGGHSGSSQAQGVNLLGTWDYTSTQHHPGNGFELESSSCTAKGTITIRASDDDPAKIDAVTINGQVLDDEDLCVINDVSDEVDSSWAGRPSTQTREQYSYFRTEGANDPDDTEDGDVIVKLDSFSETEIVEVYFYDGVKVGTNTLRRQQP